MENKKTSRIFGYIEGYYGKLLSWDSRKRIIKSLSDNNMNTYFYAPKEDLKHRLSWRDKYGSDWRKHFRNFTEFGIKKKINIIAGIAPGLNFDFKSFSQNYENKKKSDFDLLYKKSLQLLKDGASNIALLLDDIPDNFNKSYGTVLSEGKYHALLANKLSETLKKNIYFVPRIYADELIKDAPEYLIDLGKVINKNIKILYCGKDVVSKTIKPQHKKQLNRQISNEIIYWDNYYANDYCPRRLFLGPWKGRYGIKNILFNPTGMIETDLMIIDIISNCRKLESSNYNYKKALEKNKIPKQFNNLKKFFNSPNCNEDIKNIEINITQKTFDSIEFMLWEWKSNIALEWYPYLLGLKHDLKLNSETLSYDRILKTQTSPLSNTLLKKTYF